jgi:hypothetical protein
MPMLLLAGLFLLRGSVIPINLIISHFIEGLIVLTLLTFTASLTTGLLKSVLIAAKYLSCLFEAKSYELGTEKVYKTFDRREIQQLNFNQLTSVQNNQL